MDTPDGLGHLIIYPEGTRSRDGQLGPFLPAAARYRAPPPPPPVPTLLLASTHDRLVRCACSRALARAWRCALVEHPHAGHDLPLDDPQWVVQQVLEATGG